MAIPTPNPTRQYSEEATFLFAMDCMKQFAESVFYQNPQTRLIGLKGGHITEEQVRQVVGTVLRNQAGRVFQR